MVKKLILFYIFTAYFLPITVSYFLWEQLNSRYNITAFGLFLTVVNVLILTSFLYVKAGFSFKIKRFFYIDDKTVFLIAVVFFIVAFYFQLKYNQDFRHSERVSEAGGVVYILYCMRPLSLYLIYRYACLKADGQDLTLLASVSFFIILVALFISMTGSFQVLDVAAALGLLLLPRKIILKRANIKNILAISPIALVLCFFIVFVGLVNKTDFNASSQIILDRQSKIVESVALRGFTSTVSAAAVSEHAYEQPFSLHAIKLGIVTFVGRLDSLLGGALNVGSDYYLETINRYNYLLISKYDSLGRAGASPGLLASFLYLPFYPIFFIFFGFVYLRTIIYSAGSFSNNQSSLFLMLCLFCFIRPLLESPFSILNVFDPVFVTFIIMIIGIFIKRKQNA